MDIRVKLTTAPENDFTSACCSARHRAGMLIRARLIIPVVKKYAAYYW
jgi:hypothetical protein